MKKRQVMYAATGAGGASTSSSDDEPHWCIKRTDWAKGCCGGLIGLLILLGVAGFGFGIANYYYPIHIFRQELHTLDGVMSYYPLSHFCVGGTTPSTPIALTLPNDLSNYVGKIYSFDCDGMAAHTLTILAGAQPTSWAAGTIGVRTATCAMSPPQPGVTFLVVSPSKIRIIHSAGVVFS